ncbi:MAG: hypothetical protein LBV18_04000 [Alistipes sp.]|jgi:hypothetical protein|nr:hypothetical protein [Alistipes sp.]
MKQTDRDALREWEQFKDDIRRATPVDPDMSPADIERHRAELEKKPVEWMRFFFPAYAKYAFAKFQVKAIIRLIKNGEWYEVLSWSRELAKSTICMFIVLNLTLTGKKKNVLLTSNNKDNAVRLLAPYRANLEANGRIKAYYGIQQSVGNWAEDEFITRDGVAFRALGAGQSPRGSRNEAIRPDVLLMDDFDTDEECRNPDILNKKWDWFEKALYPTRSTSEPTLVLWCGNIIARDCCITRAGAKADHWDIVNIRDSEGKSTWPEKNTEEDIDRVLSKIGTKAAQGEYFNNPVTEGEIFTELTWGKVPSLKQFQFLVAYGDPAPSEKVSKQSSTKAAWLCGWYKDKFYVIKGFLDRGLNSDFIDWYFLLNEYVKGQTVVYNYVENNSLQDPFFQQVFKPLLAKKRQEKGIELSITADSDKKTDKATRIEANLEPLNRENRLVLNIDEKDNPHMKRLADQFLLFTLSLKFPADGPDCVEGGLRIVRKKVGQLAPPVVVTTADMRRLNKHRI